VYSSEGLNNVVYLFESRKRGRDPYISAKHGKAASSGGIFPVKFFPERFLATTKVSCQ
jgi:hypothetical protein